MEPYKERNEIWDDIREEVDNDAKEVTIRIETLDPDYPYTLQHTFTLQTCPGYAKGETLEFIQTISRLMRAEVVSQKIDRTNRCIFEKL